MKAFIFVALVATVAARGLDLDTLRLIKEKSLLNTRPVVDDLLLKEKLINQLPINLEHRNTELNYPVEGKLNLEGLKGINYNQYDNVVNYNNVDQQVLTFEELYQTELFREYYLRLPLVRQYIQYPAFQRYLGSAYFQKFWQIPAFRQYFLNPIYFHKYITPLVELFYSEYNYPLNQQYYGQQQEQNVYSQDLFQGLVNNQEQDVYYRNKNVLPYVYNNRYALPTSRFAGQYLPYGTTTPTNYKFLLDKVYKTLFQNQPLVGDYTQVKTDVKTLIGGEKKVVVEPITGERKLIVEEPKIVDVKVEQKIVPVEKVLPEFVAEKVDDVLLLNVLLKKHIITPEIFETVIRGHTDLFTILRQIYGQYFDLTEVTDRDVLLVKILLHKQIITPEIYEAVIRGQVNLHQIIRQIYAQYSEFHTVTERDVLLIKVLLKKHIITPEIFEAVIRGQVNLFTVLRQFYGHYIDFSDVTSRDVLLVKILLKENVITPEIYEAVIRHQIDLVTVLRQVYEQYAEIKDFDFVNRRDVVDYTIPTIYNNRRDVDFTIPTVNRFDRFTVGNNDNKFNFDKLYKFNSLYNTEYPTLRKTVFDRLPLQNMLGNIRA